MSRGGSRVPFESAADNAACDFGTIEEGDENAAEEAEKSLESQLSPVEQRRLERRDLVVGTFQRTLEQRQQARRQNAFLDRYFPPTVHIVIFTRTQTSYIWVVIIQSFGIFLFYVLSMSNNLFKTGK